MGSGQGYAVTPPGSARKATRGRARDGFNLAMELRVKRAYDPPADEDGHRLLVDGVWPRGLSRDRARVDEWARELAPSTQLRRWYGHDPARFDEFRRRYIDELRAHRGELSELRRRARTQTVTLVFAARDAERSNAAVLASVLRRGLR
jgi:uncharacterized protein YeaO (DUF488 family)